MKIEILEYIRAGKGIRQGFVDFKVTHSEDRWEIFRNAAYFKKDNRKWITLGSCNRGEIWVDRYERSPSLKNLLNDVLDVLTDHINNKNF